MARRRKPQPGNTPEEIGRELEGAASGLESAGQSLGDILPDLLGMSPKRKRDYKAEYARRKARAQQEGFSGPSQKTRYNRQARAARARGEQPTPVSEFQKVATLTRFGISEQRFNEMRKANRAHQPEGGAKASRIQHYNLGLDRKTKDFSMGRVGYIVSYYYAVTNPDTNFYSISPSRRFTYEGTARLAKWRETQARYLVQYAGIYDVDVFDGRYGDGSYVGSIGKGERK